MKSCSLNLALPLLPKAHVLSRPRRRPGPSLYMAPEQLRGETTPCQRSVCPGCCGLRVAEWRTSFSGLVQEIASQHLSAPPPSLRTKVPTISPAIEHVVLKALAKDPQQRFANVQAFAQTLEEAFNAESPGRTLLAPASEHAAESGQRSSLHSLPTGTVTLLFTDIEGSTRLLQQVGERYADAG